MILTANFCILLEHGQLSESYDRFRFQCKDTVILFEKKHSKEAQPGGGKVQAGDGNTDMKLFSWRLNHMIVMVPSACKNYWSQFFKKHQGINLAPWKLNFTSKLLYFNYTLIGNNFFFWNCLLKLVQLFPSKLYACQGRFCVALNVIK